ncbi:hypothetical protein TWF281_011438 [Arthrobotrys megalospora]
MNSVYKYLPWVLALGIILSHRVSAWSRYHEPEPRNHVSICDQLLNFRDAPDDFLNATNFESTRYRDLHWDPRWRPYNCPKIFPYFACFIRNKTVTQSCLQNTLCSYAPSALPSSPNWNWTTIGNGSTTEVDYNPRALFYRSDQNLELDNATLVGSWVAPRYYIRAANGQGFRLNSITIAFPAKSLYDLTVAEGVNTTDPTEEPDGKGGVRLHTRQDLRAKSIVIRGYTGKIDPKKPRTNGHWDCDIAILNVTFPNLYTDENGKPRFITTPPSQNYTKNRFTTVLPQTPIITDGPARPTSAVIVYGPPAIVGVTPGIADPQVFLRYEFVNDWDVRPGNWGGLGTLEISAYNTYVDFAEREIGTSTPKKLLPGEFYLKALNITQTAGDGKCAEYEEETY